MKKKIFTYLRILILILGFGLIIYAVIKMDNYPGYHEIHDAAIKSVKHIYWTGLILILIGYLFFLKKK